MNRASITLISILLSALIPHITLAAISGEDFFKKPDTASIALSPDGTRLAIASGIGSKQGIVIVDATTGQRSDLLALGAPTNRDVSLSNVSWIDIDTVAIQFTEVREGVSNLIDTKTVHRLMVILLRPELGGLKEVLSMRTSGWLVDALPHKQGRFLYAKSSINSSLYEIQVSALAPHGKRLGKLDRLDGGQFTPSNRVANIEGFATRWFLDRNNVPQAVLHYQNAETIVLSSIGDQGEPISISEWPSSTQHTEAGKGLTKIVPIAMADEKGLFYALDLAEERQRSIYKINYEKDSQELVYETDADKIIDVIFNKPGDKMIGAIVFRNGEYQSLYFEQKSGSAKSKLTSRNWKLDVVVDEKNNHALHYQQSHNQPAQYYIKNTRTNRIQLVASMHPQLDGKLFSKQVSAIISVKGLDVGYLLNLPKVNSTVSSPLIVIPHGGPFGVFDTGYFDLTTQFFTANGYAVLRVNFRGSGGYGEQLEEAGKGEWGGLMLEDILQATHSVTARNDVDAQRVCIFGMSYGGYAATTLLLRHPETYQCGVNAAGVTDLNLLISRTGLSEKSRQWYRDHVGDPLSGYEELKAVSPLYSIERLTRPLLVMHGDEDRVVDAEHSWRLKKMMDKHDIDYSWHIFKGAGHHFEKTGETAELMSRVENYIRSQLKGSATLE